MRPLYKIVMLFACVACCASASAQIRTVTFTGRDRTNQYHIPLSQVTVFNLDQLWEEVLYYPDTVLVLGTVGLEDYESRQGVQLMQNVPNPFDGTTEFALQLPDGGDVFLEIYDITGKLAVAERFTALPVGTHLFQATLSSPQTYLLSAKVDNGKMTIKMVNEGHGAGNTIHHLGMTDKNGDFTLYLKNEKASSSYPFHLGDEMQYEGFALLDGTQWESAVVTQPQVYNDTVPLLFDVTVPTVLTSPVADFTASTATCGGVVTSDGNVPVTARGVCWDTLPNPTVDDSFTADSTGVGSFTSHLSGLTDGTTYYVRAYATNSVGTAYGEEREFSTLPMLSPTVTTNTVSNITVSSATCGGVVTSDGNVPVTARGVCWDTLPNPTVDDNDSLTFNGSGIGSFTSMLSGLAEGTTYYVRAYAINSVDTAYGEQRNFTTLSLPLVTTDTVSNITGNTAVCGGNVTDAGGAVVTARGVCWDTLPNPTVDDSFTTDSVGVGSFTSHLSGLAGGTTYYVRAYATNGVGTAYGEQRNFTTLSLPLVTTDTVSNITGNTAVCGGNVISEGDAPVTARGVCWSTSINPTVDGQHTTIYGSGTGSFSSDLSGLTTGTTYYVRAYATSSLGTAYGEQRTFTTAFICGNVVADYDGNSYNTVQIGNQCWMKENLKTAHLNNGVSIPLVQDSTSWGYSSSPAYCYYNQGTYGCLYNYYAVEGGQLCPPGWHVPTYNEVHTILYLTLGGSDAGGKMKTTGTTYWLSPNTGATNSSGFSARGSGLRYTGASISGIKEHAMYWTSNTYNDDYAYDFHLCYDQSYLQLYAIWKRDGLSVRCLRDDEINEVSNPCPGLPTVTDYDGNVYHTVQIGGQCWMKENLRTTRYADGTEIALAASNTDSSSTVAYRYNPGNHSFNVLTYGYLYNWPAVMNGEASSSTLPSNVQGICPMGWHVPSDAEWTQLTNYVSGQSEYVCNNNSGYIAKALASNTGWAYDTDTCAVGFDLSSNNATGFSALPSGRYDGNQCYYASGSFASFWSATETNSSYAYYRTLTYAIPHVLHYDDNKSDAYSVRCLRDGGGNPPNAPTGVAATLSGSQIQVSWNSVSNATSYKVYRSSSANGSYTLIGSPTNPYYYDANPLTGYNYYKVKAVNSAGESAFSSVASCNYVTAPTAPTGVSATLSGTQIQVSWNSVSNATSYKVYRSSSVNGSYTLIGSPTSNYYNDANPLTGYNYYKVKAVNSTGESAFSSVASCNYAAVSHTISITLITDRYGSDITWQVKDVSTNTILASGGPYSDLSSNETTIQDIPTIYVDGTGCYVFIINDSYGDGLCCSSGNGSYSVSYDGVVIGSGGNAFSQETYYLNCPNVDEKSCPAAPTVTDHEGNMYATVQIGSQCWMRDNLRTTTSPSTGTYLVNNEFTSGSDIAYTYTGKMARWYNNDSATYAPMNYGLLYNWNAAADTFNTAYGETSVNQSSSNAVSVTFTVHRRGICPAGWHLPSDAEWTQLTNYVSSQSEYVCGDTNINIAKALADSVLWLSSTTSCAVGNNRSANNATGFGALPAGWCMSGFYNGYQSAFFWSSTTSSFLSVYPRLLDKSNADVRRNGLNDSKRNGFSVRCLRDAGTAVIDSKSCPSATTVTDHEGNVYATVQIGNQCWMRDNLRTTTSPSTGTYLIPSVGITYTYTGKQARWYNDDSTTYAPMNYGLLYNWNAAVDTFNTAYGETSVNDTSGNAVSVFFTGHRRGICPSGWHLPSDAEWTQLTNYVKTQSEYICGDTNINIAKALASETGWYSYSGECYPGDQSVYANNATGFSAVPAGYCYGSSFYNAGYTAYFWSYTQNFSYNAYYRNLFYLNAYVDRAINLKYSGFSVRCLRDAATVVIDSKSCPAAPTVTDHEGNVYATVQIGDQCWMRDNLRTTTSPTTGTYLVNSEFTSGSSITYTLAGKQARWYGNDSATYAPMNYGLLYNWNAAVDTFNTAYGETHLSYSSSNTEVSVSFTGPRRGICPSGWHLPSDAEWAQLTDYVSSQSEYTCGDNSSYIAKSLASTEGWNASENTNSCSVGNCQASNNATGFSAVPAGGTWVNTWAVAGQSTCFWSSTEYSSSSAYYRNLNNNHATMNNHHRTKYDGNSVRCLRDAGTAVVDSKSCPAAPTVTDHEGNVYATVQIGIQCWMRDNLRTTTSPSTGTYLIPAAGTGSTYTGKQAFWYNNDSTTYAPMNYGLLYNWNAAVDTFNTAYGETSVNDTYGNAVSVSFTGHRRGICPAGWHLPSDAEWNTMEATVSGSDWQASYAITPGARGNHAGKLAGGYNWATSSTSGAPGDYSNIDRNASGFSAVPAGGYSSSFYGAGNSAHFWSSGNNLGPFGRHLGYDNAAVDRGSCYKYYGFSVRCLRN